MERASGGRAVLVAGLVAMLAAATARGQNTSYISMTGTMAAPSPSLSLYFSVPAGSSLDMRTLGNGGGTNAAGQYVATGGIDSVLNLYTGAGSLLTENDDYNLPARDSRILWPGASGSYRLDMRPYSDGALYNGRWALDVVNSSGPLAPMSLLTNGTVAIDTLVLSSDIADGATFDLGSGALSVYEDLTIRSGGRFNLSAGTLQPGRIWVAGGRFDCTSGTLAWVDDYPIDVYGGGQFSFDNDLSLPAGGFLRVYIGGVASLGGDLTLAPPAGEGNYLQVNSGGQLNAPGHGLFIGGLGTGFVTVGSGGVLNAGSISLGCISGSGSGQMTVTGRDSHVSVTGNCTLGTRSGTSASLSVLDAGRFEADDLSVGAALGSTGEAIVDGPSSLLKVTGSLSVAGSGTAVLNVTGGARVEAAAVYVPAFSGGHGTLSLSGTGSTLAAAEMTIVRHAGSDTSGTVHVGAATTLSVAGPLTVNGTGLIDIAGGTVHAGALNLAGGLVVLEYGTLDVGGDVVLAPDSFAPDQIDFSRTLMIGDTTTLMMPFRLTGGTFKTGRLVNANLFQFSSGTFALTASDLMVSAGGMFGPTLQLNSDQHLEVTGAGKSVTVDPGGLLYIQGGSLTTTETVNNGTIRFDGPTGLLAGGQLTNHGILTGTGRIASPVVNAPDGRITGHSELTFDGGLTNQGRMLFSGGNSDLYGGPIALQPGSQVILSGGGNQLTVYSDLDHHGTEFRVSPTNTAVFFGDVTGPGPFTGGGVVRFEGSYAPGASPAVVAFGGNLEMGPASRLAIELANNDNADPLAPRYDSLGVAQDVALAGSLTLTWTPVAGDPGSKFGGAYDLIVYGGTLTGTYGPAAISANFSKAYIEGIDWAVDLGGGLKAVRVTLYDLLDGDIDLNGSVDGVDLRAMEGGFGKVSGANWSEGDLTFDGAVDYLDYLRLKESLGTSLPGLAPEPCTLALLGLGTVLLLGRRSPRLRRALTLSKFHAVWH